MEHMKFAEELVREFLVFRGFTNTLHAFEKELATDIGMGFQVDKILDLFFSVYIPKFEAEKLIDLLSFFKRCVSSDLTSVISKLEQSVLRYYIVNALKCGRKDKVLDFFGAFGNDLLGRDDTWSSWFAIPYLRHPHLNPVFRVYFSEEWFRALHLSIRNFLSEILNGKPALLKISFEAETIKQLKKEIKQLNLRLSQSQMLKEKESIFLKKSVAEENVSTSGVGSDASAIMLAQLEGREVNQSPDDTRIDKSCVSEDNTDACIEDRGFIHPQVSSYDSIPSEAISPNAEDFAKVEAIHQDSFLGHTGPITCGRFSASGDNIASASTDGTVRIWTHDSTMAATRNATIYCGTEITSLEWECKSDRLLLIGTSDGSIKAWNADAKRVVCDLNLPNGFPSVLDLKCSPVEPIFVSAAASERKGNEYFSDLGYALLTVWSMRTWKAAAVLPLGDEPPAITSMSFNHNGKILAAAATDGMIHMFDMSAGLQVTGWPAHESAITSICFGRDETSIFSLGADGNIFEWSLHNQGKILWSRNCYRNAENSCNWRHEMALDADGKKLLVTSDSNIAPIYSVSNTDGAQKLGLQTLSHNGSITTVDWHPTSPIFLTGSSDHSVRVTWLD